MLHANNQRKNAWFLISKITRINSISPALNPGCRSPSKTHLVLSLAMRRPACLLQVAEFDERGDVFMQPLALPPGWRGQLGVFASTPSAEHTCSFLPAYLHNPTPPPPPRLYIVSEIFLQVLWFLQNPFKQPKSSVMSTRALIHLAVLFSSHFKRFFLFSLIEWDTKH